jgi:DNA-binding LytR/AlgR family response regulator
MKLEPIKQNLRVMILDDDNDARDYLKEFIDLTNNLEIAHMGSNAMKALDMIDRLQIDVIFLDIEMPGLDGMRFMAQVKSKLYATQSGEGVQVVVCSGHRKFAVGSFDYQATDFLLKPFTFERYSRAVDEVKARALPVGLNTLSAENQCLIVHANRGTVIFRINFDDIIYIEVKDERCHVYVGADEYYVVKESLRNMVLRLPRKRFVKVHRSFVIAISKFDGIVDKKIRLIGTAERIPTSEKDGRFFINWRNENSIRGAEVPRYDPEDPNPGRPDPLRSQLKKPNVQKHMDMVSEKEGRCNGKEE